MITATLNDGQADDDDDDDDDVCGPYLLIRLMMVLSAWKSGRSAWSSAQHLFTVVTNSSLLQPSPYSSASPSVGLINVGLNGTEPCPFFTSL